MSVTHWGEIPTKSNETYVPDVLQDIENSMNQNCLAEFDEDEEFLEKSEKIVLSPADPFMLYAISLHKHANQVLDNSNSSEGLDIKLPKIPDIYTRHKKNNLNYVAKEFTDFTTGVEIDVPELSTAIVKQILVKCVATMLAHISYETSQQSALDVLCDVLEEFFKKITKHYKIAVEDEEKGHPSNFPHKIERVLTELGMGGINGLKDYYNCRILRYITVLQKRYKHLNIPQPDSPADNKNKIVKVNVEQDDNVRAKNAEVYFSTIEGDVNPSILEPGYQLLNSLEANSQNLVETKEANMSESVSTESDMSHLSPYNKKKKYK